MIGDSFAPMDSADDRKTPSPGEAPIQSAIQVLKLHLPKFLGAGSITPLSNAPGSGGLPPGGGFLSPGGLPPL